LLLVFSFASAAQSSDQGYPTAVTENVVHGRIRARDVGDARLTTYYYTFSGEQGDLFVNIVTTNLNGSIDVFTADALKPLTKVMVYADLSQSETGRVIYLRKPEKLILRVEGRSPNDEAGEFQIKFAGTFVAGVSNENEPPVPKVTGVAQNDSGVRVNSVGTIVEVIPKVKPTPKAERTVAEKEPQPKETKQVDEPKAADEVKADVKAEKSDIVNETTEKPAESARSVEVSEPKNETPRKSAANPTTSANRRNRTKAPAVKTSESVNKPAEQPTKTDDDATSATTKRPPKVIVTDSVPKAEANPLANVHLVILFKDGTKVERPMTEVERFTVDQRTLTVLGTNGRTSKFSMLEVASVSIR